MNQSLKTLAFLLEESHHLDTLGSVKELLLFPPIPPKSLGLQLLNHLNQRIPENFVQLAQFVVHKGLYHFYYPKNLRHINTPSKLLYQHDAFHFERAL